MAYVTPSSRTTGDLITASVWNQDVVDNVRANPAELAQAAGDLFVGDGSKVVRREPLGATFEYLRVNGAGDDLEWAPAPGGWQVVASGAWTGTALTISSLSGFRRYWALVHYYHVTGGGGSLSMSPAWNINSLSANFHTVFEDKQFGAATTTDGNTASATTIAALGGGGTVDTTMSGMFSLLVFRASVSAQLVFMGESVITRGQAPQIRTFRGYYSGTVSSVTSLNLSGFGSWFAANTGSHYVVLGSDSA